MMFGQIEEVYQALQRNGDVEFDYKNKSYAIEAAIDEDEKRYLEIWTADWKEGNYCLYREETFLEQHIEKEVVDKVLNAKFHELEADHPYDVIYLDIAMPKELWRGPDEEDDGRLSR